MIILRTILYLAALVTVIGSAEGFLGGKLGLHTLLMQMPVYPDSPTYALLLGLGIFAVAEYITYVTGEVPIIIHVAAFIARIVLIVSTVLFFLSIVGVIISLLAATGPMAGFKELYPPAFFGLGSAWLSMFLWLALLVISLLLVHRLDPRFAGGKHEYPGWLRAEDFEEVWEQEHRPDAPDAKQAPSMRQLTTRGIRPIYVERRTFEPLGRLSGEVGLLNIFVDSPSATWPDDEIMNSLRAVRGALRWIEKEAKGRVGLKFKDIGHVRTPTPGWPATDRSKLTPKELKWQALEMLGGIGIESLEDLHYYLLRYSDEPGNIALFHFYLRAGSWCLPHLHPNVGIAYCFHRHDPEMARPHFLSADDLRIYPELSSVYAHLILHMFGASDKPMKDVHPNIDIMSAIAMEIDDLMIGFKTAREIGW